MKKLTGIFKMFVVALSAYLPANAQLTIDGTNLVNSGYILNNGDETTVAATPGSAYNAGGGAVFEHNEAGLKIDNPWDANLDGGSTDNFNGPLGVPGNQEVSGNVAPNFSSLGLKNGSGNTFNITNTAGVNVFSDAKFENGITSTVREAASAGALRFQPGSSYTGGLADAQHVDGYVGKAGNTPFAFPVGSGTDSRPLTMGAPQNENALITTAYEPTSVENPQAVSGIIRAVFPEGSWDWHTASSSDDDGLAVSVSMPDVSSFGIAQNLRLVGWDGTQWVDLSGNANANGVAEGSTLAGTIPSGLGITQIGIGSIEPPLPVTLVNFLVENGEGQTVTLKWNTTFETNSDRFEIERSFNGESWLTIGLVSSHGESSSIKSYAFTDPQPVDGINYYRLRMVDIDATFAYSSIKKINVAASEGLSAFPNPAVDKIQLSTGDPGSIRAVELYDNAGRIVYSSKRSGSVAISPEIDVRKFRPGVYLIHVTRKDGTERVLKVAKQ
nr:T9SS type A sorting domain-containing protein [uncultured Dyadobacter sp.]